jgi:membrane protease subunit HflK
MSKRGSNPFDVDIKAPDMEKVKKTGRRFLPIIVVVLVLIVLAFNTVYSLDSGEEAVITRIGSHVRTERIAGLQFKIPFIEQRHVVSVTAIRSMEFGARDGIMHAVPDESLMLTGEDAETQANGLVNADWVIQYRVYDSYNWFFKVEDVEATLRAVTQSAYRRVAAARNLDEIITYLRSEIQYEVRRELQDIVNLYQMGILITEVLLQNANPPEEVREAFVDVSISEADRDATIYRAQQYQMEELPRAEGRARAAVYDAQAYSERRVNEAYGAVARFNAVKAEYVNHPEIMRTRLYLEMIREVMPQMERIYFLDSTSGNLLEILHLGEGGGFGNE